MSQDPSFVRTRFAPSPTGSLHVGGARTALYCLLVARKAGGRFLLRIEDTDRARSTAEAAAGLLRDLDWLGLDWDEGPGRTPEAPPRDPAGTGPFFQSERLDHYAQVYEALGDRVYEAWETPDELKALRDAAGHDFHYRRRPYTPDDLARFADEGRTPVLRFAAPDHHITIADAILDEVVVAAGDLDDFVVRKADGFPTYHLAVVADDHAMGVTHVIRGQEHLLNTPKHLGLYDALGWEPPLHAHLPLIFNPGGGKMSKRDKARHAREVARAHVKSHGLDGLAAITGVSADELGPFLDKANDRIDLAEAIAAALGIELPMIEVHDFRKGGLMPEALVNYLALLGWSAGDDKEFYASLDELVEAFDLSRVGRTNARFDPDKLLALNKQHVMAATLDRLAEAHAAYLEAVPTSPFAGMDEARRRAFLAVYQPRLVTFADLDQQAAFFFEAPDEWAPKAVKKHVLKADGVARLDAMAEALSALAPWTDATLDGFFQHHADRFAEGNLGKVIQPVRIALTGTGVSPGIEDTLLLLGRDEALARIAAFQRHLASLGPA